MTLIKDGLWGIVDGTEEAPMEETGEVARKFVARRNRALATIVLAVDPSLLYLLGNPTDPAEVWNRLEGQFQRKTWANKLELRKRLFGCRLANGGDVQDHLKAITEIFHELVVVGNPIEEEDQVVYLLASLPESYNVLVTALESHAEVPDWEVVTERLLGEDRKRRGSDAKEAEKGLAATQHRSVECFRCGRFGHVKKNCRVRMAGKNSKTKLQSKEKAYKAGFGSQSHVETDYGLPAGHTSLILGLIDDKPGSSIREPRVTCAIKWMHLKNSM
jgi:Zinc knuckle.